MIKSLSFTSLSALAVIGASIMTSAPVAANFYVGASVGEKFLRAKRTDRVDGAAGGSLVVANNARTKQSKISAGVLAGYNWFLQNSSFVGIELYTDFDKLNKTVSKSFTIGANTITSKFKRDFAYGAALRGGMNMGGYTPYIKIGVEASRFKHDYKETDTPTGYLLNKGAPKATKTAFVPGIGISKVFGKCEGRLEYSCALYRSINHRFKDSGGDTVTQKLKSLKVHALKATFAYGL